MNQFVNLCSNSEYFKQHPEKVAGIEVKTTSRNFPFTIEGTREDVEKMFAFMDKDKVEQPNIHLIEAEALAELAYLELMEL